MNHAILLLLAMVGCSTVPVPSPITQEHDRAIGPWEEVPTIELPTGDTSIPISLLQDTADALLKRPGAKACNPLTQRPIVGLSTEYCTTVYVAGSRDTLSWRVTEPVRGDHDSCNPFSAVRDVDYPASHVWVVGYIHNHPCAAVPSSRDLGSWPTDAFNPYVAMAEVRLIPGNPTPAIYKDTAIEMASAIVAERQDGTRVILRYFPTGEIQQWSQTRTGWVSLGRCSPRERTTFGSVPQCDGRLQLLNEARREKQ